MADEADVGAVDAHAEGIGGDHDIGAAGHEAFLCGTAVAIGEAAVVTYHRAS